MHPAILHRPQSTPLSFDGRQCFQEEKVFEHSCLQKGLEGHARKQEGDTQLIEALRDKILSFRDVLHLPPQDKHATLHELLLETLEELQKLYPKYMSCVCISEVDRESINQILLHLYKALKFAGNGWSEKCNQSKKIGFEEVDLKNFSFEQLGREILKSLDCMSSQAKEVFDLMEKSSVNISMTEGGQDKLYHCNNPVTPTSVLPQVPSKCNLSFKEFSNTTYLPPLLRPLRLQALAKLKPLDVKHLSFHMFPLVSDQSSKPSYQTEKIENDFELDSPGTPMIINSFPYVEIEDDSPGYGGKTSHFTTPMSTPTFTHLPMNLASISNDLNKHNEEDGNKTSEATILISQNIPFLHLKAPLLSPTPTPPSSPMILTGVPMFFRSLSHRQMEIEPIAYATIDDSDQPNSHKPSDATMLISQPSTASPPSSITSAEETISPAPAIFLLEGSTQLSSTPTPCNIFASTPPLAPQPKSFASVTTPSPPPTIVALSTQPPPLPSLKGSTPPPPPPLGAIKAGSIPPPPPPLGIAKAGITPPPPPPLGVVKSGSAPPPPPSLGAVKSLRARNNTKLKRSSQMGSLYRLLKGKVEGSSLNSKISDGKKSQVSGSSGEKAQGMADALAEMTKRSAYFQQIEEDIQKYATIIMETKSAINSFRTKDMIELLKFHQYVEQHLEKLTDETQVLARFEGFPSKKLENIRMAAALYIKLDAIITTLKGWKSTSPIAQQLDKVESYFNKIKKELDVIERTKDEESKRFQIHNIDFDFGVLLRIKESMVDLSSNCIEMALKESKEAKEVAKEAKSKPNSMSKMLWRAFQLAFRVYNFAGGQDDRADRLTSELAKEIETCP